MKEMRRREVEESTKSGQTGMLSNLEVTELDLLRQIYSRKKEVSESKDAEKGEKDLLEKIKGDQLGDAIYAKCMLTEPMKNKYIKALNRKRKRVQIRYDAIKDANKSLNNEQVLAKLAPDDREALLMWAKAKADGNATTGKDESNSDSTDDGTRRKGGRKKAGVVDSIVKMSSVGSEMLEALRVQTPLEVQMTEYYRAKAAAAQSGSQTGVTLQSIEERLKRLDGCKGFITPEEYAVQRKRILDESL
jgi:hypothetical protein